VKRRVPASPIDSSDCRRRGLFPVLLLAVALLAAQAAGANPPDFGYGPYKFNYDPSQKEVWREEEPALPAYPEDAQLQHVPMPAFDAIKVYVDKTSVTRGKDDVLRFTLVVETSSGTRNVFYEGIRCSTREYKTYAIGTHDRRLHKLAGAAWQFIAQIPHNGYRYEFYAQYACDTHKSARHPREFLESLSLTNSSRP
jgi:hypothetical protein